MISWRKPRVRLGRQWLLLGALVLILGIAEVLISHFHRTPPDPDTRNIPLGVEQAAIITYSGPPIAVAPYKWGVAVNVRIAGVTEEAGARIYDVRYLVNRGGTFDLKDYLAAADGTKLEGLPSFQFHGDPKLSKDLDARIQETEPVRVEIGGHYYAILAVLVAVWLAWLLLLIFYRRPRKAPAVAPNAPEPALAELLRRALAELQSGALDAAARARLEMLVLRRWREVLALRDQPMSTALAAIGDDKRAGPALRQIEHWLHHPASPFRREEIAAVLAPFAVETPAPAGVHP